MPDSSDRFPGYDVLSKRDGPSWNNITRRVIDARLSVDPAHQGELDEDSWRTLVALCARIVPQPPGRPPVPLAAIVARKAGGGRGDGFRQADMPRVGEAWRRGLKALDAEARARHDSVFAELAADLQDELLRAVQKGDAHDPAWAGMPPATFFKARVLHDITAAYYGHPTAWNEIGFGGPASPRGYVRTGFDRRDPWEAVEAVPGREDEARIENKRVR